MKGYILVTATFCLSFSGCYGLQITEIMYNPDGTDSKREWIEVYNDQDQSVDLASYVLLENNVNHGITHFKGLTEIPPGSYAVIAGNAEQFVSEFSGTTNVYDSVFTLNNTGENISILDEDGETSTSVTYQSSWGGEDDGNSLNLVSGNWVARKPSPGLPPTTDRYEENDDATNRLIHRELKPISDRNKNTSDLQVVIPDFAIAEQKFDLSFSNKKFRKCQWDFGNGITVNKCDTSYNYSLPGTYTIKLVVSYRSDILYEVSQPIMIESPRIELSSGIYKGSRYLKVTNKNSTKLDLSNWQATLGSNRYVFPDQLSIESDNDYVFRLDEQELIYPIKIWDDADYEIMSIAQASVVKQADETGVVAPAINLPTSSNNDLHRSAVIPDKSDIESFESKQNRLRLEFEGYQNSTPADIQFESEEIIAEPIVKSEELLAKSNNSRQLVNHMSAIVLGGLAMLMFVGPGLIKRNRSELAQSTKDSDDDTMKADEFEIINIDDEEDF